MKVEQAVAPSLEEFKSTCRAEFAFLVETHGFREVPGPPTQFPNPFEVHFERSGWRIIVEGQSYGFGADVVIRSPDGKSAYYWHLVPEDFRAKREGLGRGQLGDVRYQALCVRTFGGPFLAGNWSGFSDLVRMQSAWIIQHRKEEESAQREWKMRHAIQAADDAFRSGRYETVISELSRFEPSLPPSQLKKLEIARKRKRS